ncbi:hypothetical protein ABPG72_004252 [Tetrahymena utriculariae]
MEIERPKKADTIKLLSTYKSSAIGNLVRPDCQGYKNVSDQFVLKDSEKKYEMQYWKTYFKRLDQIKEYFLSNFSEECIPICDKILNIKIGEYQVVIATLYKDMKLKPNALTVSQERDSYMADDDVIYMEDQTGRMQLAFNNTQFKSSINKPKIVDVKNLTSGLVLGIRGIQRVAEINVFEVQEIYCCDLPHQEHILKIPAPLTYGDDTYLENNNNFHDLSHYIKNYQDHKFLLLTSGLNIDPKIDRYTIIQLKNHLFGLTNLKPLMSRVCRVVIAGNLIEKNKDLDYNLVGSYRMQEQFKQLYTEIAKKMHDVDKNINDIAGNVCLDIMPGDKDPAQAFLPQQPMNKCYFSSSKSIPTFQLVSNPYKFEQDNIQILGVSGQSMLDIKKYSNYSDKDIDIIESHLLWRHISPTSPDTLQCFPFHESDPFILDELPHVYFSGNSPKFETKMIYEENTKKRCRLICVPAISDSNSFVIMNLTNLDTFEIKL